MDTSIIICTRNRCGYLKKTLLSMEAVCCEGHDVELIVVDNCSTDATRTAVETTKLAKMRLRYLFDPKPGQSHARNTGLEVAEGEVIVFIDDDVRPHPDWLLRLTNPICCERFDVVVGRIEIAPHLLRGWMTVAHRTWLASTEEIDRVDPQNANGGNFAFVRRVLETRLRFDTELGPGALGFKDDTLFTLQLKHAGFRFMMAEDAVIEHHFCPDRLRRKAFLARVQAEGRSDAYLHWHWFHFDSRSPRQVRTWRKELKLQALRLRDPFGCFVTEGCANWEMERVRQIAYLRQYAIEQRRPRNYEKFGLIKCSDPHVEALSDHSPGMQVGG